MSCFVSTCDVRNIRNHTELVLYWSLLCCWMHREAPLSEEDLAGIYRKFSPVVYRRSLAILADPEEALDALQDIFIILHRNLPSFRGESTLLTWIYRITTNHCLNRLRSGKTHHRTMEQISQGPDQREKEGEDTALMIERRDLIWHLLSHFDDRKVQIVFHCYYDEMTQVEVAGLLGISERAVRKALKKVKEQVASLDISLSTMQEES